MWRNVLQWWHKYVYIYNKIIAKRGTREYAYIVVGGTYRYTQRELTVCKPNDHTVPQYQQKEDYYHQPSLKGRLYLVTVVAVTLPAGP